jgi:hypothetical protein
MAAALVIAAAARVIDAPRGAGVLFYALLMAIPHFVMERKMLLGIKQRAERARTSPSKHQPAAAAQQWQHSPHKY